MKKKLLGIVFLVIVVLSFNVVVFAGGPGGGGSGEPDPVINPVPTHASIEYQLEGYCDSREQDVDYNQG